MKIALLQFYSHAPTPEMHELSRSLRRLQHHVLLATPDRDGNLVWDDGKGSVAVQKGPSGARSIAGRIPVIRSLLERFSRLRFLWCVRGFVRMQGFDVVQINPSRYECILVLGLPKSTLAILDVRQAGEVNSDTLRGRFRNWRVRTGLRLNALLVYDHACFASEAAAERILGKRWPRRASIHRVGQHPSFLAHVWIEPVAERGLDPVRFLYLGTISRVRRLEHVIQAIARLRQKREDFVVDFVGPDASGGGYPEMIRQMGLERWGRFLPPIPYAEVASFVASYDVALVYVPDVRDWHYQPTLKILEFRGIGMPIIATDNPPNRDLVEQDVNGVLIGETVEDLATAMERFAADREFLDSCKENARRMRRAKTWDEGAQEYVDKVYLKRQELSATGIRRLLRSPESRAR